MRWEALFEDLEAQLDAAEAGERSARVSELTRAERATVHLADRLRAAAGREVVARLHGGEIVRGTVVDASAVWVLLAAGTRQFLVPLVAVASLGGLDAHAAPEGVGVLRRLGLGHALRAVSRDRAAVRIGTSAGDLLGRVDAVGADHVDLTALDDAGRALGEPWAVPFDAIRVVASP